MQPYSSISRSFGVDGDVHILNFIGIFYFFLNMADNVPSSMLIDIKNAIFPDVVANVGTSVRLRSKPVMSKVKRAHAFAYIHAHVGRTLCNA